MLRLPLAASLSYCVRSTATKEKHVVRALHSSPFNKIPSISNCSSQVLLNTKHKLAINLHLPLSSIPPRSSFHILTHKPSTSPSLSPSPALTLSLSSNKKITKISNGVQKRGISFIRRMISRGLGLVAAVGFIVIIVLTSGVVLMFVLSLLGFIMVAAGAWLTWSMWARFTGPIYRILAKRSFGNKFLTTYMNKVDASLRMTAGAMSILEKDEYVVSRIGSPIRELREITSSTSQKTERGAAIPLKIIDLQPGEEGKSTVTTFSQPSIPKFSWSTSFGPRSITSIFPVEGETGTARVSVTAMKVANNRWELTNIRVLFDNWERWTVLQELPELESVEPDQKEKEEREEDEKKRKKKEEEERERI